MKKLQSVFLFLALAFGLAFNASATGVDLSTLTGAIDLSTVSTAILAVAALLMAPRIVKYAATTIMKWFPK